MTIMNDIKRIISKLRGEEHLFFTSDIEGDTEIGAIYEAYGGTRWRVTRNLLDEHGWYEIWGKPLRLSTQTPINTISTDEGNANKDG